MSSDTQIHCEVDLDRDGCQGGFLRVPHSVHRSAYGWVPVPVVSIRNGDGPVVLLLGGNHGDEYEGQVSLSRLAGELEPDRLSGQVIILPMANYPAARAGTRTSPLDGGNLNRSFPGSPLGGPTAMIAHFIESELMPRADFLLDIHSGGSSMQYRKPTLLVAKPDDPAHQERLMELVAALDFPQAVLYTESRGASYSTSAARRNGVLGMTAEMAGGGGVSRAAMSLLDVALPRYLAACGVYNVPAAEAPARVATELFADCGYLYARNEGVFEPAEVTDDPVEPGDSAGWIHYPDVPFTEPVELRFEISAKVLSVRMPARVERGDCLYELGFPISSRPGNWTGLPSNH
ncbi:MAG: succinylglutamate desuccinylase/aspartoacylase family protein [Gammaproteobacteria bacterium]|nr:succinylglutamate desuccinylase/aspartoacylase family protein [Gammaproteobacteria bacterium]